MSFKNITSHLYKHPATLAIALFLCTVAAALGLLWIPFEGTLETMLPEDSEALRTVQFFSDANFADKLAVSVEADPEVAGTGALIAGLDRLVARFEASPLIENVITFPGGGRMMEDLFFFLEHCWELLDEEDMKKLQKRTSEDEIHRQVRSWYSRLARPEGSFAVGMMRRDPLDLGSKVLARIESLSQSFGYQANVEGGHLIHPDGGHGLLLLETGIPVTDAEGARELVALTEKTLAGLPEGLSADFIAGHRRSVSNEKVLRRDISLTVAVASAGFLLLFLGIFRDPRAIVLFLLPGASVLFALNLSALLLGRLSYLVIGFGAVLAGIAVDYSIHVYVSVRHSGDRYEAVSRILKPIFIGALTTLSVFAAFLASSIPGYRQLGVFAVISIALSILAAVFFLPAFLKTEQRGAEKNDAVVILADRLKVPLAILFLLSLPVCAAVIRGLQWDTDIISLDGTERHILETEKKIQQLWSGDETGQAIAVVEDDNYRQASEKNYRLHTALSPMHGTQNYGNIASIWPPVSKRSQNLERWADFWDATRIEDTWRHLREAGEDYGFSADAFDPFFNAIKRREPADTPRNNAIYAQFEERFVKKHEDGYRFMTFFPDTQEANAAVSHALSDMPNSFIASPAALGAVLSESITSEVRRISIIALVFIACIITILVRNIRMSIAALLPAATGLLWLFAIMALSGLALNIANLIAGIVVIGLCIDYGIFMVHGCTGGRSLLISTRRAIMLSAATTLMGAGVLIFATHPALFSIGLTLVIGVAAGFLCAVLAVPGMCVLLGIKNMDKITVKLAAVILASLLLGACYSPPFRKPELEPVGEADPHAVLARHAEGLAPSFETENTIIFRFFRSEIAALGYASVDREKESYEIICVNHMGAQLFHISGDKDGENQLIHAIPEFREYPGFADAVGNDIRRIYFGLMPGISAKAEIRRNQIRFRQPGEEKTIEYVFGGPENMLLKKRARSGFSILWEVSFYEYFQYPDDKPRYSFPGGVVLHNREHRYRLIIKTRDVDL